MGETATGDGGLASEWQDKKYVQLLFVTAKLTSAGSD